MMIRLQSVAFLPSVLCSSLSVSGNRLLEDLQDNTRALIKCGKGLFPGKNSLGSSTCSLTKDSADSSSYIRWILRILHDLKQPKPSEL